MSMIYTIQQNADGAMPDYDPLILADELLSRLGSTFGLSTAGDQLSFPLADDDAWPKITAVVEQHLSADAVARRQAAQRRTEILARLDQIDAESVRPLRAHIAGSATSADDDKLKSLDAEAETLRKELAALT